MTEGATRRDVSAQVHVPISKRDFVDAAAPDLLDRRVTGVMLGSTADEFWCSAMRKNENGQDTRKSASFAAEPVCGKLRLMFDVASEPMPESLSSLADRLDRAFERGELFNGKSKKGGR